MTALLAGETVQMPVFNFLTGQREYKGDFLKLGRDDILVLEGIHGLMISFRIHFRKKASLRFT